jgi:glutathione synthase/RimK-type ligase-like ATP-grasp enzyme
MKILILSCNELSKFISDDELMIEELKRQGHHVVVQDWSASQSAHDFDCAIVRTTWDYVDQPSVFLNRLQSISEQTQLLNDISLIRWNLNKTYLRELEANGISIVPTQWIENFPDIDLDQMSGLVGDYLIKPTISASAYLAKPVKGYPEIKKHLESNPGRSWMLQPFLPEILTGGEISLHYFNHQFSHAIRKTPKKNDFRVQEEHGGLIVPVTLQTDWLEFGRQVLKQLPTLAFQARVDFVETKDGLKLMELELIEPALYFRTNVLAKNNFCSALASIR